MNFLYLTLSALTVCCAHHGLQTEYLFHFSDPFLPHAKTLYQWNQLEFSCPQQAESCENLKPIKAFPIDVQPYYDDKNRLRTFVTIPRLLEGIPYSLATVSKHQGLNGPLLEPYPNYKAHDNNNGTTCADISSAFRVAITECNTMWVIDAGLSGPDLHCPPQLLLFDLNTHQLIHRYRFDTSLYTPRASLFVNPLVVVRDPPPRGTCKHTMVYVADARDHGLVVYDFMHRNAWRVENKFMYPDPKHRFLCIDGESFVLFDGILGLATDKINLYFHPLASSTEYKVPLRVLDNSTLFKNNKENMNEAFIRLGTRKSECVASAMDSNNNLYCVTLNPIELIRWNVHTPYNIFNINNLFVDPKLLQFVSGMKVVRNRWGKEELWMLSNRSQKIIAGTQNPNEVNFRIVVLSLADYSFGQIIQDKKNAQFSKTFSKRFFKKFTNERQVIPVFPQIQFN